MYSLLLWGEMLWRYQLNPFDLMCHLRSLFPCWLFSGRSVQWWQWGVKIPYNDFIAVNRFLKIHQDLLYIFRCSYVGCISVYKGYTLLLDWSLYHYVESFFVCHSFCFKIYSVWWKYCYPSFSVCLFPLAWNVFLHPFTFVCVSVCVFRSEVGLM